MEEEQPVKRSKRWIWITCLLVVVAMAVFFGIAGAKKPTFAFIERFKGKQEETTLPFTYQEGYVLETYTFEGKIDELRKAFESEALARGWSRMTGAPKEIAAFSELAVTPTSTASGPFETQYAIIGPGDFFGAGSKATFYYFRKKSWFERQYDKIKGWIGAKKPESAAPLPAK